MKKIFKYLRNKFFGIERIENMERKLDNIEKKLMPSQAEQVRLSLYYKQLITEKKKLPSTQETGFRVFSQSDEDGILLFLFSIIGTTNKICVDIAFASPYGSNTANLICNFGWWGFFVCGSQQEALDSKKFFSSHPDSIIYPPKIIHKWVTVENVNDLLLENGISGEVDFLSLDMDGVDYWIWKNLTNISPRVVVVEALNVWGVDKAVTVPYSPDFDRFKIHPDYMGASIKAFVKLAEEKGYVLVASNKYGFNLFFVKKDIVAGVLPILNPEDCLKHPQAIDAMKRRLPEVKDLPWQEV
ncbi:MAG: hypothetical protein ABIA74_05955 [bacterium]